MKKIAIIFVAMLLIASPLFAAAVTDSTKPLGHMKFSASVEDNYIFNRDIKKGENRNKFEVEDTNQIYGKLAMGLTPYFNVYAKLGASDGGTIKDEDTSGNNLKIDTDYGFLWGVGVSGAKEIAEGWKLGLDTQFSMYKVGADKIKYNSSDNATNVSGDIVNFEFQATPFVSKKFFLSEKYVIDPYLGVKFSHFTTETDDNIAYRASGVNRTTSWTYRGEDYVGIVVGSDLEIDNKWALNFEGRFIDETAFTVGGAYKF